MDLEFYPKFRKMGLKGVPKYAELRETLRNAIASGYWKRGEKLPAEIQIADMTPFSLGTVQKALRDLVAEGLVERIHGRGTFVSDNRYQMIDPWHFRFCSVHSGKIMQVFPRVLSKKKISKKTTWAQLLNPHDNSLIQIDRIISIMDEFLVYSKFYLSAKKFISFLAKSDKELSSMNFKTILHQEYNISFTNLSHTFQIVELPADICKEIKVQSPTIGLLMEILAISGPNNPIYYQEVYIPPNNFKLYVTDSSTIPECWR